MTSIVVTSAMLLVVEHFRDLGPRWGLNRETCAAHALLYLCGRPLSPAEIADGLRLDAAVAGVAIDDLIEWRMAVRRGDGLISTSGEPWDLMFAAMEERRRRELAPALVALAAAAKSAAADGTQFAVAGRIHSLVALVQDLAALGEQVGQLSSKSLARLVGFGGRFSRVLGSRRSSALSVKQEL
jgi:DNA-binding transcriptional regulator GbsR (MarR family)